MARWTEELSARSAQVQFCAAEELHQSTRMLFILPFLLFLCQEATVALVATLLSLESSRNVSNHQICFSKNKIENCFIERMFLFRKNRFEFVQNFSIELREPGLSEF